MSISQLMQIAAASNVELIGGLLVENTELGLDRSDIATDLRGVPYDWVVPSGVISISALVIGGGGQGGGSNKSSPGGGGAGGGLTYATNIPVTPGETLRIYAGQGGGLFLAGTSGVPGSASAIIRLSNSSTLLSAPGGPAGDARSGAGVAIVNSLPEAGAFASAAFSGGSGLFGSGTGGQGGGASGYGANGNTGLGGSGFGGNSTNGYGGGGVGVYGEGASGTSLTQGGSGGEDGSSLGRFNGDSGGAYGGGGGGGSFESSSGAKRIGGNGSRGAVRIIWGEDRSFPSTKTALVDSNGNEATVILEA